MTSSSNFNIIILCLSFHFFSVGYITCFNAQGYIIESIKKEDSGYKADSDPGFIIFYITFGIATVVASILIKSFGLNKTIVVASFINGFYIAQFLYPTTWAYYFGHVMAGSAGGILWTAQGNMLERNSNDLTINRNTGILWACIQSGALAGNIFMGFSINDDTITYKSRMILFGFLTSAMVIAFILTLFFKTPAYDLEIYKPGVKIQLTRMFKLAISKDMLFLTLPFFYNGLEWSFTTGIYSSAMGRNEKLHGLRETTVVAISGILISCGSTLSGLLFGILGKKTLSWGRFPIIVCGFIAHLTAYILIFLNFPDTSIIKRTTSKDYSILSDLALALVASFALGFGDACYVTQIYGLLSSVFVVEGPLSFSIFHFYQCIGSSFAFAATPIGLYGNLLILLMFSILAFGGFWRVEKKPTYMPEENVVQNEQET